VRSSGLGRKDIVVDFFSDIASGVSVLGHANLLPAISNIALKNIKQAIFSWGFRPQAPC